MYVVGQGPLIENHGILMLSATEMQSTSVIPVPLIVNYGQTLMQGQVDIQH
jgi:hypothetical protein